MPAGATMLLAVALSAWTALAADLECVEISLQRSFSTQNFVLDQLAGVVSHGRVSFVALGRSPVRLSVTLTVTIGTERRLI